MEPLSGDPATWPVAPPGSPFYVPPTPTRVLRRRMVLDLAVFAPLPVALVVFLVLGRWRESAFLFLALLPLASLRWLRARATLAELRRRRELSPPPDPS
ncbi:hypothetical protein LG324_15850 [Phycicoccus jejuensis]|uniref:hypothetical protein n=1 Tax=Phycicoccus jejuensis TaxID=367299 RepID=UPI003850FB7A